MAKAATLQRLGYDAIDDGRGVIISQNGQTIYLGSDEVNSLLKLSSHPIKLSNFYNSFSDSGVIADWYNFTGEKKL